MRQHVLLGGEGYTVRGTHCDVCNRKDRDIKLEVYQWDPRNRGNGDKCPVFSLSTVSEKRVTH